MPTSARLPDDPWDPYVVQDQEDMLKAVLTEATVKKIQEQVTDITNNVPRSKTWNSAIFRRALTHDDLCEIIRISFGEEYEGERQLTAFASSIPDIIDRFQKRAQSIPRGKVKHRYAQRITYFIRDSLVRVQEFLNDNRVSIVQKNIACTS